MPGRSSWSTTTTPVREVGGQLWRCGPRRRAVADDHGQVLRLETRGGGQHVTDQAAAADGCKTLAVADFIRVPPPAARTMTAAGRDPLTIALPVLSVVLGTRLSSLPRLASIQDLKLQRLAGCRVTPQGIVAWLTGGSPQRSVPQPIGTRLHRAVSDWLKLRDRRLRLRKEAWTSLRPSIELEDLHYMTPATAVMPPPVSDRATPSTRSTKRSERWAATSSRGRAGHPRHLHRAAVPRDPRGRADRLGWLARLERRGHRRSSCTPSPATASRSASTGSSRTSRSSPTAASRSASASPARWPSRARSSAGSPTTASTTSSPTATATRTRRGATARRVPALMKGLLYAHMGWLFDTEQTSQRQYAPDLLKDKDIVRMSRRLPVVRRSSRWPCPPSSAGWSRCRGRAR